MARKYKYKIGDWVEVRNFVRFMYVGNKRKMVRESDDFEPFIGQIVGYKYCSIGTCYNEDEGARSFSTEKSIGVWLVRRGLMNRSRYVRENDLSLCPEQDHILPKKFIPSAPWTDAAKEVMRQEALHMKRDKKGKFLPIKKSALLSRRLKPSRKLKASFTHEHLNSWNHPGVNTEGDEGNNQ